MIAEVSAAFQSLNTLVQLTKTAHDAVTQAEKNEITIRMQNAVLDLQAKMMAMHAKMDELTEVKRAAEAKLVAYENWDAEAAKYQLTDHGGGQLVMTLKNPQQDSAPSHWLCPNCFQKKEKSYLSRESMRKIDFKCIRCGYSVCIEDAPTVRIVPRVIR